MNKAAIINNLRMAKAMLEVELAYAETYSEPYPRQDSSKTLDGIKKLITNSQVIILPSLLHKDEWECKDSPTGYCDYHQEDGSYDEDCCRYCGEPEERK